MEPGAEQFARLHRFAELVAGDPDVVPLDRTVLAIAAVLRSRSVDGAVADLDDLAASCPRASFDGLRRHLFDRLGFGGPRGANVVYDDPEHSFLDVVVARRVGLPILLATVMIEVGRRAGVPVVGVGMPMHFLVRSADDPDAFVDPFTGRPMDRRGARDLFDTVTAGRLPWHDRHLEPTSARLLVVRILTNLRSSYHRRHDAVRLALVARMRAGIPELGGEVGEAVRLGGVFN